MLTRLDYMDRDFLAAYLGVLYSTSQVRLNIKRQQNIRSLRCLLDRNRKFPALKNHLYEHIFDRDRRTAAVSTPVGPPPQTTNDSKRLRSSRVVIGRLAVSKLSEKPQMNDRGSNCKDLTEDSSSDGLRIRYGLELETLF
jgi:hypothetical protein